MEKYDKYLSNQNNENVGDNIDNISLNKNYEEKKYFLHNNYFYNHNNIAKSNSAIFQKKENYPYYFEYSDKITNLNSFFPYHNINYKIKNDTKLNDIIKSDNIIRNEDSNLKWYENYTNSNFYKQGENNKINSGNKIEKNNFKNSKVEHFIEDEVANKLVNSLKVLNNTKNKSQFKPYLIKNKYSELFS